MAIYLGLGSNEGDRIQNLHNAVNELERTGEIILSKLSSIFDTEPVGFKNQKRFLNAVIEIQTKLAPYDLLKLIKGIEKRLGRKETFKDGPRIIDIDILSYNNKIVKSEILSIPHPELHLRKFVLIPLSEIASDYIHPINKLSVWQMLKQCPDYQVKRYSVFNIKIEKIIEG